MSNIWHGADPTGVVDAGAYELGTVVVALQQVSLTGLRVWSPANAVNRPGRRGHVWSMSGALLATVTMTDALAAGWSVHLLDTPLAMAAGDFAVVSYETSGNYGAIAAALGAASHVALDAALAFPQSSAVLVAGSSSTGNGRFTTSPGTVPNSSINHTFYGVDATYDVAGAGTAPTVTGLALSADGLQATATISATDPDGLTGATYRIDWGDGNVSTGATSTFTHTYAEPGLKAILASVTDATGLSGYRAGAIEVLPEGAGLDITAILNALESHAAASGRFEKVNTHEPKNAPPNGGLTAALWVQQVRPYPPGSGLAATTGVITFTLRIYQSMLTEPQDMIDPNIVAAADAMLAAYSSDFKLGGLIRNIDLLGASGTPLSAQAGYISVDRTLYRVMDLTIPCVVNDLWSQVP